MEGYCNQYTTKEILEQLDNYILYVLDWVRRYIEGLNRDVLFSQHKVEVRTAVLYW